MRQSLLVTIVLNVVCAALPSTASAREERVAAPSALVMPVELRPTERETIPLALDRVMVATPGTEGRQELAVSLRRTYYDCTIVQFHEGQAWQWSGGLHCYELDAEAAYTWAVWSPLPLGMFQVFTTDTGANYLAWVCGLIVQVAEVSSPRDRSVALTEYFAARDSAVIVSVPTPELIPRQLLLGRNALYAEIRVLSVAKDEAGNWVVKISGPDSPEVYTLVCENGQWRRE